MNVTRVRHLLRLGAALGVASAGCSSGGGRSSSADTTDTTSGGSDGTDATDGSDGSDGVDGTSAGDGSDGTDGTDGGPVSVVVDLRADSSRDGVVDVDSDSDDLDEDTWSATRGAIFLANVDDDSTRCDADADDVDLPKCNDATDEVLNGLDDLEDLAPLVIIASPSTPDDAVGTITLSPSVARVFYHAEPTNPEAWAVVPKAGLPAAVLQRGVELRIEAKDIVRDSAVWDGYVDVTLNVATPTRTLGTDTVRLRVSPVMTYHHLLPAEVIYATKLSDKDSIDFRSDLSDAIAASGLETPLFPVNYVDQWSQDFFETGYMSMPAAGGKQHAIRVNYRSANVEAPNSDNPLRQAGRFAFDLRGKDAAAIQEYDPKHAGDMDSLNSFGNTETIPPYEKDGVSYPLGRLFRGRVDNFFPDPRFATMLESQAMQPPVYIDTSWLLVGHVDETITFLPTNNARGWTIGANDARLAKKMLEDLSADGNGAAVVFQSQYWDFGKKADTTIDKLLANEDVLTASAKGAAYVDSQLEDLLAATGVSLEEVAPFAFLHEEQYDYSVAHQPGTVNGILINRGLFAPPKPHGPVIDGKDPFETQVVETLKRLGIATHFVEDWDLYHRLLGEVHCGSNATRQIPDVRWWETGR